MSGRTIDVVLEGRDLALFDPAAVEDLKRLGYAQLGEEGVAARCHEGHLFRLTSFADLTALVVDVRVGDSPEPAPPRSEASVRGIRLVAPSGRLVLAPIDSLFADGDGLRFEAATLEAGTWALDACVVTPERRPTARWRVRLAPVTGSALPLGCGTAMCMGLFSLLFALAGRDGFPMAARLGVVAVIALVVGIAAIMASPDVPPLEPTRRIVVSLHRAPTEHGGSLRIRR